MDGFRWSSYWTKEFIFQLWECNDIQFFSGLKCFGLFKSYPHELSFGKSNFTRGHFMLGVKIYSGMGGTLDMCSRPKYAMRKKKFHNATMLIYH